MTGETTYLRVKNWETFQHYKDRRPPWIKFHTELLDDHEMGLLTLNARLVYSLLLLVAARTDNNIPSDTEYISRQITVSCDIVEDSVKSLLKTGFLVPSNSKRRASKALASRKQDARPSQRRIKSREEAGAHTREKSEGAFLALATMIANGALTNHIDLEAEIRPFNGTITDEQRKRLVDSLEKFNPPLANAEVEP